jgi:hypothetical protein
VHLDATCTVRTDVAAERLHSLSSTSQADHPIVTHTRDSEVESTARAWHSFGRHIRVVTRSFCVRLPLF